MSILRLSGTKFFLTFKILKKLFILKKFDKFPTRVFRICSELSYDSKNKNDNLRLKILFMCNSQHKRIYKTAKINYTRKAKQILRKVFLIYIIKFASLLLQNKHKVITTECCKPT